MDNRVTMLNLAWGMPEYNHFGTDEFLRFCKLIGAEPQIALNLGTGTPREAAEWVRYVNQHWNGRQRRLAVGTRQRAVGRFPDRLSDPRAHGGA